MKKVIKSAKDLSKVETLLRKAQEKLVKNVLNFLRKELEKDFKVSVYVKDEEGGNTEYLIVIPKTTWKNKKRESTIGQMLDKLPSVNVYLNFRCDGAVFNSAGYTSLAKRF